MADVRARIQMPIIESETGKFPTAFRSIIGIGAVSGNRVRNFTIGESGVETNSVIA